MKPAKQRSPNVLLENYYVRVANFLDDSSYKLAKRYEKSEDGGWSCTLSVKWPEIKEFSVVQRNKSDALSIASSNAVQWLESINKIDADCRPIIQQTEVSVAQTTLRFKEPVKNSIHNLCNHYEMHVKPFYDSIDGENGEGAGYINMELPSWKDLTEGMLIHRNNYLFDTMCRMLPSRMPLPIDYLRDEIVHTVENNRVVVIEGATGSGKTTRVPQFIFESYIQSRFGTQCNILVTQPRRISAISVSARIAEERQETFGNSVGHHVRFSVCYPTLPGSIVFVSTGILLQRLFSDPTLQNISHVIIDEAHERDLNTDLLLMLLKNLLYHNHHIKVIIMSATMNAQFFQTYFHNCPLICVPGKMYPVREYFMDDEPLKSKMGRRNLSDKPQIDEELIINVVHFIHSNRPDGAILVFLPGWGEICRVSEKLRSGNKSTGFHILAAHSMVKMEDQQAIFRKPPFGKRKVILATNIAETSITIPDVVYVIDTGLAKGVKMINGVRALSNQWISKAVAKQRTGRAGRLCEGECFRLYTRQMFYNLNEYPIPDVLIEPLENLVLKIKMLANGMILDLVQQLPEKPPIRAVTDAVRYLQTIAVFDSSENLTPLGKRIANFGMQPHLSVALLYSVFFNCLDPMLFLSASLNGDGTMFDVRTPNGDRRTLLYECHPTDDNIASYRIYSTCIKNTNPYLMNAINKQSVDTFTKTIQLNLDYLLQANLITNEDIQKYYSDSMEDVKESMVAPTLFAINGQLAINTKPFLPGGKQNTTFRTLNGLNVSVSNDGVNYKRKNNSSCYLTYNGVSSNADGYLRIYGTSELSLPAVILFRSSPPKVQPSIVANEYKLIFPNVESDISIDKETMDCLLKLREMLWTSLKFFVKYYNSKDTDPNAEHVKQFRKELVNLIEVVTNNDNTNSVAQQQ